MDEVKTKFKSFMKKVNNQVPSSSTSGKFKGQGRVLGGAQPSSFSGSNNTVPTVQDTRVSGRQTHASSSSSSSKQLGKGEDDQQRKEQIFGDNSTAERQRGDAFDPFETLITSGKVSKNGFTLQILECPICGEAYRTEEEVSLHVNSCANNGSKSLVYEDESSIPDGGDAASDIELEAGVSLFLSSTTREVSVEILQKLMRNIAKEPENSKFRRIRMGNPKIKEAITEVAGGIELLKFIGFEVKEEGGELWAIMENTPNEKEIAVINKVASVLDGNLVAKDPPMEPNDKIPSVTVTKDEDEDVLQKIERQIRVFFSVPESVAARIELPDSFYNLSVDEIRRQADDRKKRIDESQLLIPKSFKEKQAKATRKKYRRTLIRVQFPDGVVLQGVFAPWESVTALYEFVAAALKNPSLEFELLDPVLVKRRTIPHSKATLQDEGLVPSALIKFKHIESDSSVFTGLSNELLQISEPLIMASSKT